MLFFMGSYHDISCYLPKDITVTQVKDQEKINAYFRELVSRGDGERFDQLAEYLASPCANSPPLQKVEGKISKVKAVLVG